MKKFAISTLVLLLAGLSALGQPDAAVRRRAGEIRAGQGAPAPIRDPIRVIDGTTNLVSRTGDWCPIYGTVVDISKDGIRVMGLDADFFVANFPYQVANGDYLQDFFARRAGLYNYVTVLGGTRTIHKFDYGQPVGLPPPRELTAQEVVAAQILAGNRKAAADLATFKFHQERAEAGNVGSMYRLGHLYLAGQGCAVDTNLARGWFERAAAAGSEEAKEELKKSRK